MIHQKLLVPLTAVVMTGAGWMLNNLFGPRLPGAVVPVAGGHSAAEHTRFAGVDVAAAARAERKRPSPSGERPADHRGIRMNADGSVTLAADMVDRLRIAVLLHGDKVNREELALLGVDGGKADRLQSLVDEAVKAEAARQARRARVLHDGEDGSTILIPAGEDGGVSGDEAIRKLRERVEGIVGPESRLAADSFMAGIGEIAKGWRDETLVIDTRLNRQGKREYKVFGYRHGFMPPADGVIDPVSLADRAFSQRIYREENVPEDLKHLFK